jgi:hypothetical protein
MKNINSICSSFNTGKGEVYVIYSFFNQNGDVKFAKKTSNTLYGLVSHLRNVDLVDIVNVSPNVSGFDFKKVGIYQFLEVA